MGQSLIFESYIFHISIKRVDNWLKLSLLLKRMSFSILQIASNDT